MTAAKNPVLVLVGLLTLGVADLIWIDVVLAPRLAAELAGDGSAPRGQTVARQSGADDTLAAEGAPALPAETRGAAAIHATSDEDPDPTAASASAGHRATTPTGDDPAPTAEDQAVRSGDPVLPGQGDRKSASGRSGVGRAEPAVVAPAIVAEVADAPQPAQPAPIEPIRFASGKATLTLAARRTLRGVARVMKQERAIGLLLEGHTDRRGSEPYNRSLGKWRALTTRRYLTVLGVAKRRVRAVSVGSAEPLDRANSPAAWAKNRRVQFVWESMNEAD